MFFKHQYKLKKKKPSLGNGAEFRYASCGKPQLNNPVDQLSKFSPRPLPAPLDYTDGSEDQCKLEKLIVDMLRKQQEDSSVRLEETPQSHIHGYLDTTIRTIDSNALNTINIQTPSVMKQATNYAHSCMSSALGAINNS